MDAKIIIEEKSSLAFQIEFYDFDDSEVVPDSITWSLTDGSGAAVNSRTNQAITPTAQTVTIVLSGDDLEILVGEAHEKRCLTVRAVFDSIYGANLTWTREYIFYVENLSAIS